MTHETILGPPGTGKTQTNSNRIRDCIEDGIPPDRIACVSFTRTAAGESRERVCNDWGFDEKDLPYFQTLHSMAFRAGGFKPDDVMRSTDLKEIGAAVGIPFASKKGDNFETDLDMLGVSKGDFYMNQYHLARSRRIPLEEMHRQLGDYSVHWSELNRLVAAYEDYKENRHKIDFTDMIEQFIQSGNPPGIDALFVDEAQDLSTLQWKMIDVLRQSPRIQVFTGDDDQAIMGFQGADVGAFLRATEKKTVLEQSYRDPKDPWKIAQNIVGQIEGRAPKTWYPTEEEGRVVFHQGLLDVPLHEGKWCILARTNRIASMYAESLMEEGLVYSRNGHPSIPTKTYEAMLDWEEWVKGKQLPSEKVRNIYTFMEPGKDYEKGNGPRSKAMLAVSPESLMTSSEARGKLGLLVGDDVRWHQALSKIDVDTKNYILNALRRDENVKNPRIRISTIHSMKGGEEDIILVIPDLSRAADKEYRTNPNTEHRVYYVAVTRAKQSLHIMEPETRMYYTL